MILNDSVSHGTPSQHTKDIFIHFWMNWDIFDDFEFKCLNFFFFKILQNPGGVTRYTTIQICLALGRFFRDITPLLGN